MKCFVDFVKLCEAMTSFEIRKAFLRFFEKQGHKVLPSSSLIPQKDPSLLFVNAGMNQFKPVILGLEKPPAKNVVTIQKCMRAGGKHNDLENVGQTFRHNTFFEMMGNFSFGGYFKQKAIEMAWKLFTEELNLNPDHLWISVYKEDEESYEIWRDERGLSENKIYRMGKEDNFWQMGETGPCGPCTEIHYYKGKEKRPDPDQLMEFGNLVFMEFDDKGKGKREKLSVPCVDTGIGLERLSAILQNKKSIYHTDCFAGIIQSLEEASGCKYDFTEKDQSEKQMAFRVLADHSRAAAFLMSDGVLPGNEGRSYVLRRILRRGFFYSHKLNKKENLLQRGAEALISFMKDVYPNLEHEAGLIGSTIDEEANQFSENLHLGQKILFKTGLWTELHELKVLYIYKKIRRGEKKTQLCAELSKDPDFVTAEISESSIKLKVSNFEFLDTEKGLSHSSKLSASLFKEYRSATIEELQTVIKKSQDKKFLDPSQVWHLRSTYGFPFDLTRLMAEERGYQVNLEEVEKLKKKQISSFEKGVSQREHVNLPQALSQLAMREGLKETQFTGYEKDIERSQILRISSLEAPFSPEMDQEGVRSMATGPSFSPSLSRGEKGWLITDKTCFYPEGGGPIGDRGTLKTETGRAEVLDCQKKGNFICHEVKVIEGKIDKDQQCEMKVDANHRLLIEASHSATHLLHQALRKELGSSVRQAGSLVLPGKLRFDFTYSKPLTEDQIEKIERQVKKNIQSKNPVSDSEHSYEEAVQSGALFMAGENYSSQVRVITMGESREFCGGIHVKNTSDIGCFKIISETGVQSGVRRITAYVNEEADKWLNFLVRQNFDLRKYLQEGFSGSPDEKEKLSNRSHTSTFSLGERQTSDIAKSTLSQGASPPVDFKEKVDEVKLLPKGEENNPFVCWIKMQDEEIKQLKNQLKNFISPERKKEKKDESKKFQSRNELQSLLKNRESLTDKEKWIEQNIQHKDFLAGQVLELRKYLKLPAVKDTDQKEESPFIPLMENKKEEVQSLKNQLENLPWGLLSAEKLKQKAKVFQNEGVKGNLLVINLPVTDRKILADMVDQLKLKISPGVVVLLGEGQESWPLMVAVTQDLQKYISAGELMKKTITPLLGGKGGGQARFAQGMITDKESFSKLEKALLQALHPIPPKKQQISEAGKSLRDFFVFPFRTVWFENLFIRRSFAGAAFSLALLAGIYIFMLPDRQTAERQTSSKRSAKVKQVLEEWKKEKRSQKQASGRSPAGEVMAIKGLISTQQILQVWVLTAEQIQALTSKQVQALTTEQIRILTAEQIQALTSKQVQALTTEQIRILTAEQIQALTSKQVQALTTEQIKEKKLQQQSRQKQVRGELSTDMGSPKYMREGRTAFLIQKLTMEQIKTSAVGQIQILTAEQIQALTADQLQSLTAKQIRALTMDQIQALTAEQIRALTMDQIQALTPEQIQSFTVEQAKALTSEQLQFLTPEQIRILTLKRKKVISPK